MAANTFSYWERTAFIDDADDKQYVDALQPFCQESFCVNLSPKLQRLRSLQGLLSGEALSLPYYRNSELQTWVDKTLATQGIERVLIFSSSMAQYVEKYPNLHVVADFVDVDSFFANWNISWL